MNNTLMTIIGCIIIFAATTVGASLVYLLQKQLSQKLGCIISGFSAGIMFAASIWSLILPSISYAEDFGKWSFVPAVVGIAVGGLFILLIDLIIKISNRKKEVNNLELNKLKRFVFAFTMHNIPEGMAVGFAFGCALQTGGSLAFAGAMGLAIGIAIQNIPEGLAVAVPVYKYTKNKHKSFLIGTLSGVVEPLFAVLGIVLASLVKSILPWALAFSAGAMLFVSVEDLIPDAKYKENSHLGTWSFIIGFLIMMLLDVVLG